MGVGQMLLVLLAASLVVSTRDPLLNVCMDAKHHKTKPGPEGKLYEQCSPWKDNACCTANTTAEAHRDQSNLYSFNWNHCGVMPPKCKRHFIQDTCLYECSPNLGPWIDQGPGGLEQAAQRASGVPLCGELPTSAQGKLLGVPLALVELQRSLTTTITTMLGLSERWTAAGAGRGSSTCPSARRTARSGGRTARTLSPARRTGTRAGTGPQVGDRTGVQCPGSWCSSGGASRSRLVALGLHDGHCGANISSAWGQKPPSSVGVGPKTMEYFSPPLSPTRWWPRHPPSAVGGWRPWVLLGAGTWVRSCGLEALGPLGCWDMGEEAQSHQPSVVRSCGLEALGPPGCSALSSWRCPPAVAPPGTNRCPWGAMCRPFKEVFPHPKDLCEKIWSHSYSYTTLQRGSGRCIQMWFDPAQGNPNVVVAKYYAWKRRTSPAWVDNLTPEVDKARRHLPCSGMVLLVPLVLVVTFGRSWSLSGTSP